MKGWIQCARASARRGVISIFQHIAGTGLVPETAAFATFLLLPAVVFGQAKMETPGQFAVSPHGAATYSIPIEVPPGTAGMEPSLSLNYNSQTRSGMVGVGWSLGGLSVIHRCGANPTTDGASAPRDVTYTLNDKFCLDGQRMVLTVGTYGAAGSEYRTEKESFTRIIAFGVAGNGPQYFLAYTKAGQILSFGANPDSRILPIINGVAAATPRTWALNSIHDRFANWISFTYAQDSFNGAYYPTDIFYTGNSTAGTNWYAKVHFNYEARSDTANQYVGPAKINFTQRLSGIDTYTNTSALVKRYFLTYGYGPSSFRSKLNSIKECAPDGVTCLNPTAFTYNDGGGGITTTDNRQRVTQTTDWQQYKIVQGDFNGDRGGSG